MSFSIYGQALIIEHQPPSKNHKALNNGKSHLSPIIERLMSSLCWIRFRYGLKAINQNDHK